MNYVIDILTVVIQVYILFILNRLTSAKTRTAEKKPLKTHSVKPKNESEEERKRRILIENLNNYGTDAAQREVK